jgi:hypothetical protein
MIAELMAKMTLDEKIGQLKLPHVWRYNYNMGNSSDVAKNI